MGKLSPICLMYNLIKVCCKSRPYMTKYSAPSNFENAITKMIIDTIRKEVLDPYFMNERCAMC